MEKQNNRLKQASLVMFMVFIAMVISGCASHQAKHYDLNFLVATDLNMNRNEAKRPSPVSLTLYQLKEKEAFAELDYQGILSISDKKANPEIVDYEQYLIKPGKVAEQTLRIDKEARYLAVVVDFRNQHSKDKKNWIKIIPLNSQITKKANHYRVHMHIYGNSFQLMPLRKSKLTSFH